MSLLAKNLRIGNYFHAKGNIYSVEWLAKESLSGRTVNLQNNFSEGFLQSQIEGIALTEELLSKCTGFTREFDRYLRFTFTILETTIYLRPSLDKWYWGFENEIHGKIVECEIIDVKELDSLHELQNLYWTLSNFRQELEIKDFT